MEAGSRRSGLCCGTSGAPGSAAGVERVHETQEVEQVEHAGSVAVGGGVGLVEQDDEADEVEEIERLVGVAVAGARGLDQVAPAGDVVRGQAAGVAELPAGVEGGIDGAVWAVVVVEME